MLRWFEHEKKFNNLVAMFSDHLFDCSVQLSVTGDRYVYIVRVYYSGGPKSAQKQFALYQLLGSASCRNISLQFFERLIVIIFLPIGLNICFGCSKESSHWDGSFECP